MLNGLITNKEIRFITSENVELEYAADFIKNKAIEIEKEGKWKKFGDIIPIYDKATGSMIFAQAMIRV